MNLIFTGSLSSGEAAGIEIEPIDPGSLVAVARQAEIAYNSKLELSNRGALSDLPLRDDIDESLIEAVSDKDLQLIDEYEEEEIISSDVAELFREEINERIEEEERLLSEQLAKEEAEKSAIPDGPKLTKSSGVFVNKNGNKETYYNLNMSGVVAAMSAYGFAAEDYSVREDGVKLLGGKVMVAANYNVYPKGSIVETSLGEGIVCDTGGFAYSNPTQFDIAVSW